MKKQQNNAGFTLIEIIFAMFILAIVAIPIFNAFVSSARTSAKAVSKMRATNVAENVIEDIKTLSMDKVIVKYGLSPTEGDVAAEGMVAYSARIIPDSDKYDMEDVAIDGTEIDQLGIENAEVEAVINAGYYLDIKLDPTWYKNANGVNIASFNAMNEEEAAIYAMSPGLDSKVYGEYADLNEQLVSKHGHIYDARDISYFSENLKREIRVDIDKIDTVKNDRGEDVDICTVDVYVTYVLYGERSGTVIPSGREVYHAVSKTIFSNVASKKPLSAVAIMYYPRYDAAGNKGDIISVHNPDNVSTNLYIIAQEVNSYGTLFNAYTSMNPRGGLILNIFEDTVNNELGQEVQPITLFTNLHDGKVATSREDEDSSSDLLCYIRLDKNANDPAKVPGTELDESIYQRIRARSGEWGASSAGKTLSKALNARDIDGRSLYKEDIEDRIYNVTVKVDQIRPLEGWPNYVEITGTKLNK